MAVGRGTTLSPAGQIVTFQQANLAAIVHHGLGDRALKDPQDTQQDENHDDDDHSANPMYISTLLSRVTPSRARAVKAADHGHGDLGQVAQRRQGRRFHAFPVGVGCTIRVRSRPRPRLA
jgi:hypothetical protein